MSVIERIRGVPHSVVIVRTLQSRLRATGSHVVGVNSRQALEYVQNVSCSNQSCPRLPESSTGSDKPVKIAPES